jgi:hypothetical protein
LLYKTITLKTILINSQEGTTAMSEKINVDHAFDPEARQAQKDLDSRPYKDENGNTRDAENNLVDSNYFDTQREQHEAETMPTAYEDMTMPDLARALASAEHEADKTKSEDIQDALLDKMAEFTEKNNLDNDAQENLWNRIMKVKDGESERLGGKKDGVEKVDGEDIFNFDNPEDPENDQDAPAIVKNGNDKKAEDREADVENTPEVPTNTRRVFDITTDIDEAKAYWERELKEQGVQLEDYLAHEKQWGIVREVEDTEPTVVKPEPVPLLPMDPRPVVTEPPVKPIVSPTPAPNPTPAPMPVPTPGPRPQEGGERRPAKKRKITRSILAGLALLGSTYAAGRLHENYIIKSHDTPSIDVINKAADSMRDLATEDQENIVRNFDQAGKFFESIKTDIGAENFSNLEKMYNEAVERLTTQHGGSLTKERINELAQKEITAKLAALDYNISAAEVNN